MTTYSAIPDANLDPDKPARSLDALALRDNAAAVSEGDPTAPGRLCLAGSTSVWSHSFPGTSTVTSYETTDASTLTSELVRVFATGTIRAEFDHIHTTAAGTAYARIIKNGSLVQEWTITGNLGVLFPRTVDFSVSAGDVIGYQVRVDTAGQGSAIQSRFLRSDRRLFINSVLGA